MKPTRWLAFAAALTGCAVAYGIHLLGRHETTRPLASRKSPAGERRPAGFRPSANPANTQRVRPSSRPETDRSSASVAAASAPAPRRIIGAPDRSAPLLSEAQWRENATRVEMEANHELNRLANLLDLDPVQQDKVFASVARQSPYWLPGMQAGGPARSTDGASHQARADVPSSNTSSRPPDSNGNSLVRNVPSANPATNPGVTVPVVTSGSNTPVSTVSGQTSAPDLTAYLDADQQQTLVEEEMDRQAWWAEVLPQLLPPNFGEAAASAIEAAAPATKEFDGGEVLLEE